MQKKNSSYYHSCPFCHQCPHQHSCYHYHYRHYHLYCHYNPLESLLSSLSRRQLSTDNHYIVSHTFDGQTDIWISRVAKDS